jgi:excinuclease ABC subunit A
VRIDGIIYRIEEAVAKTLARYKKHNIEVVVDRLILDKDLDKSRLVDSLETALKLGKGIVIVVLQPDLLKRTIVRFRHQNELVFSEHFACEECGVSLPELEPRLFSFNSPYGACPACQGLGEKLEVDPKLVIPNPNLSIAEGAIFPWAHASHKVGRQGFFWWQLEKLAETENIDLYTAVKNLPREKIDLILYGSENFEGVIPWLEKRYHETDSEATREEIEKFMVEKKCEVCQGKRLRPEALAVTIDRKSIADVVTMSVDKTKKFFENLLGTYSSHGRERVMSKLNQAELKISQPIIKEIINRLQFLIDVGLNYLTLDRKAATLAGGEEQRIRLATQIGSKLSGVLYILDEPSVGLHPRDQGRLIKTLKKLRDLGNSVLVVEHDPQTIMNADWVIDIGPGAGKHGGKIIFQGTPKELLKSDTLTGQYLSGKKKVEVRGPNPKS